MPFLKKYPVINVGACTGSPPTAAPQVNPSPLVTADSGENLAGLVPAADSQIVVSQPEEINLIGMSRGLIADVCAQLARTRGNNPKRAKQKREKMNKKQNRNRRKGR